MATGCDLTNLNTGSDGGIERFIEMTRTLYWLVCALRTNELLLRHLLTVKPVDMIWLGRTTSACRIRPWPQFCFDIMAIRTTRNKNLMLRSFADK